MGFPVCIQRACLFSFSCEQLLFVPSPAVEGPNDSHEDQISGKRVNMTPIAAVNEPTEGFGNPFDERHE